MRQPATLTDLQRTASKAKAARTEAARAESALSVQMAEYIGSIHGSGRDLARDLGFSAAYVCDVRHGRRRVSDEFLRRLVALQPGGAA